MVKEMNMCKLLDSLKYYFENTPKEQLDKDWEEIEPLNGIGPDVFDALGLKNNDMEYSKDYYASFDLSKKLKDIGFNWGVDSMYSSKGDIEVKVKGMLPSGYIRRPMLWYVKMWLLEIHKINVYVMYLEGQGFYACVDFMDTDQYYETDECYEDYEDSLESGIDLAINKKYKE